VHLGGLIIRKVGVTAYLKCNYVDKVQNYITIWLLRDVKYPNGAGQGYKY